MPTKYCPHCQTEKPVDEFNRNAQSRDGLQSYCRPCHRAAQSASYRKRHAVAAAAAPQPAAHETIPLIQTHDDDMKRCYTCKTVKPRSEFYSNKSKRDGLSSECKVCTLERQRVRDAAKSAGRKPPKSDANAMQGKAMSYAVSTMMWLRNVRAIEDPVTGKNGHFTVPEWCAAFGVTRKEWDLVKESIRELGYHLSFDSSKGGFYLGTLDTEAIYMAALFKTFVAFTAQAVRQFNAIRGRADAKELLGKIEERLDDSPYDAELAQLVGIAEILGLPMTPELEKLLLLPYKKDEQDNSDDQDDDDQDDDDQDDEGASS